MRLSFGKNLLLKPLAHLPQPMPLPTKYPVILMHGLGALAGLKREGMMHDLALMMRQHGIVAFAPNVVPYHAIAERAKMWKHVIQQILQQTKAEKVNVICHSMGGLDARYLVAALGGHEWIASIITISTPHHGTYLAQHTLEQPKMIRQGLFDWMDYLGNRKFPMQKSAAQLAIQELTPTFVQETFNLQCPNHPDVLYWSCAGKSGIGTDTSMHPIFAFQNRILHRAEGVNDGIVSVNSARWGQFIGEFSANHAQQIGIFTAANDFNVAKFYLSLIELLQDESL